MTAGVEFTSVEIERRTGRRNQRDNLFGLWASSSSVVRNVGKFDVLAAELRCAVCEGVSLSIWQEIRRVVCWKPEAQVLKLGIFPRRGCISKPRVAAQPCTPGK